VSGRRSGDDAGEGDPRRVHHPLFARVYSRLAASGEAAGAADHRRELLDGLRGRVVEVGAGPGTNFGYYPPSVRQVVAVEPERFLLRLADRTARGSPVPAHPVAGHASALPLAGGWADAVVFSLVLCTVGSPAAALFEAARVLAPGGELRFYEHVRSENGRTARRQDLLDRPWSWVAGGCHPNRDTLGSIAHAGFAITGLRRFEFLPRRVPLPVAPHVIGRAAPPT
jgi:SAM-dependent methyltransferase